MLVRGARGVSWPRRSRRRAALPGVAVALARGSLSALRVGARVEAGGSFGIPEGARVVGVRRGLSELDGDELFRLGGLGLSRGLELTLWFGREAR